ncbi:hypothetical protein ACVIJW_007554 [Bradyrhizobium barranii subsp. barranii]
MRDMLGKLLLAVAVVALGVSRLASQLTKAFRYR